MNEDVGGRARGTGRGVPARRRGAAFMVPPRGSARHRATRSCLANTYLADFGLYESKSALLDAPKRPDPARRGVKTTPASCSVAHGLSHLSPTLTLQLCQPCTLTPLNSIHKLTRLSSVFTCV